MWSQLLINDQAHNPEMLFGWLKSLVTAWGCHICANKTCLHHFKNQMGWRKCASPWRPNPTSVLLLKVRLCHTRAAGYGVWEVRSRAEWGLFRSVEIGQMVGWWSDWVWEGGGTISYTETKLPSSPALHQAVQIYESNLTGADPCSPIEVAGIIHGNRKLIQALLWVEILSPSNLLWNFHLLTYT